MPIFLGLLHHLNQIFKIKKSIYIHELEMKNVKMHGLHGMVLLTIWQL